MLRDDETAGAISAGGIGPKTSRAFDRADAKLPLADMGRVLLNLG